MEVICLQEEAFYALLEQVVARLNAARPEAPFSKWMSPEQAMQMLNITSRTTLQKFRDTGRIRYTQPEKRIILYDRDSILEYLDLNAKETF